VRQSRLDCVRHEHIVSIEEDDMASRGAPEACVTRAGKTTIALADKTYPFELSDNAGGIIASRAIVHNDDFIERARLGRDAIECVSEKSRLIEDRDDDGNGRAIESPSIPGFGFN
jgi:hypothetical protein